MFEKLVRLVNDHILCVAGSSMFSHQGLTKAIPGTPPGRKPIHEVESTIFGTVQK
jgi:NADH dehydrogenase (ubiquinone) 1 alpha subcomplex subunit 8